MVFFFHWTSYISNLITNDLKRVRKVRNDIETASEWISFAIRKYFVTKHDSKHSLLYSVKQWLAKYNILEYFLVNVQDLKELSVDTNIMHDHIHEYKGIHIHEPYKNKRNKSQINTIASIQSKQCFSRGYFILVHFLLRFRVTFWIDS